MNDTIKTVTGDNPRYAAYARAHGRTPEAMLEHDRAEFPGGCMAGFIVWMSKQKPAFFRESPWSFVDQGMIGDQAAWTAFLERVGGGHGHEAVPHSDDRQRRDHGR